MAFQDDIKSVLTEHGAVIMQSVALPNILADTSEEYNNTPGLKNIFKDFFHEGNGEKVLALQKEEPAQRALQLKQIGDSFAKKNGYAVEIVAYIISCLSYVMGWTDTVDVAQPKAQEELPDKISANPINLQRALAELKLEYTNQMGALYTQPVYKLFYIQPGYFSAEALSTLRLIENKVAIVVQALGLTADNWCSEQLQSFIGSHQIKKGANKKRILTRLGIPSGLAVVAGLGMWGGIVSGNNLDAYNKEYESIDRLISSQDYDKAILGIVNLNQKYSGRFGVFAAISEANSKVPELVDAHVSQITADGRYDDAIAWLQDKQKQYVSVATFSANITNIITTLTQEKASIVKAELPKILNNIKANKGHLNVEGQALLKKLLNVDPDNYWLKFIASKEL